MLQHLCWRHARLPKKTTENQPTEDEARQLAQWVERAASAVGTRAEAARVAGITPQQLQRLIAGTTTGPSVMILLRLAEASGQSLDALRLPPVRGELDIRERQLLYSKQASRADKEVEAHLVALARRIERSLRVAYAEVELSPTESEVQHAASTLASYLKLGAIIERDAELISAAAEQAVVIHRQAHRLLTGSPPRVRVTHGGPRRRD